MAGAALLRKALIVVLGLGLLAAPIMAAPRVSAGAAGVPAGLQDKQHDAGDCCECCGATDEPYRMVDCLALCVAAYALPELPKRIATPQGRSDFRMPEDHWKQRHTTPDPDPPNLSLRL